MDEESAEILNMFTTVRPRSDFPRIAMTFRIATTSHDLPLHTVRLFDVANGVFRHREESLPCRRSKVVQWAPGLSGQPAQVVNFALFGEGKATSLFLFRRKVYTVHNYRRIVVNRNTATVRQLGNTYIFPRYRASSKTSVRRCSYGGYSRECCAGWSRNRDGSCSRKFRRYPLSFLVNRSQGCRDCSLLLCSNCCPLSLRQ
ncbi:hypothetical protein HOLleu_04828 [Holothuria leucospilota]|uniref:Uncharacterized protein n=1 Tax=Holothuria leucospilota TaxID=206669 RepID=A0A9Q1CIS5_HOLLE|nr:hypothetical protein HOLleu_04828 [Holothuria leucospilota]